MVLVVVAEEDTLEEEVEVVEEEERGSRSRGCDLLISNGNGTRGSTPQFQYLISVLEKTFFLSSPFGSVTNFCWGPRGRVAQKGELAAVH